jgi:S-adenosylmethionine hydrolase
VPATPPIITLTTDFGLADPYVAAMKGVILSLNPNVTLIDVTHAVRPQRPEQGAFLLETALPYLPPNAVHLAVVDPGVGTARRAIAVRSAAGTFVGPDNGLLSPALPDDARAALDEPRPLPLPDGVRAVALTDPRFHRLPVSDTFHGRDVFAPVAAHLSLGTLLSDLGEPIDAIAALPAFRARAAPDGALLGRVLHVDAFGNLITDLRAEDLPPAPVLEIAGVRIAGLARTYGVADGPCALVGSSGFLEVALPDGSAAAQLGVDIGEPVTLRPASAAR